tara:strand:- start:736 stop:1002 length:267 start_codon:yes stop_codon:yes gene_type:complete
MIEVIEKEGCIDCMSMASIGQLLPDTSCERENEIVQGFEKFSEKGFYPAETGTISAEFSNRICEICDSKLAGERFNLTFIGQENESKL